MHKMILNSCMLHILLATKKVGINEAHLGSLEIGLGGPFGRGSIRRLSRTIWCENSMQNAWRMDSLVAPLHPHYTWNVKSVPQKVIQQYQA